MFVTLGNIKGQTLLPLPPSATVPVPSAEPSLKDQDKIHILESAIVTWTKQIKAVLKSDPDAPLKVAGQYPGPMAEVNFWGERAANLNSIHEQLTGEKIQKVVKVLELARSTYFPAFGRYVWQAHVTPTPAVAVRLVLACAVLLSQQVRSRVSLRAGCFRRLMRLGWRPMTTSSSCARFASILTSWK